MGYESRVKIMTLSELDNGYKYAEDLCTMNLSCMGHGNKHDYFNEIFKRNVDFNVYFNSSEDICDEDGRHVFEPTKTDSYGAYITYATAKEVIDWLLENINVYRRHLILLQTLQAYVNAFGDSVVVVHYGY